MAFVWSRQDYPSALAETLRSDYRRHVILRLSSRLEEELRSMAEALRRDARTVERSMAGCDPDPERTELAGTIDRLVHTTMGYLEADREETTLSGEILELYDAIADARCQVRHLLDTLRDHQAATHA